MPRYAALITASLALAMISFTQPGVAATEVSTDAAGGSAAAITDPARPDTDRQQDVNRKPAEILQFIALKPGDRVVDFIPGGGYFTRLFSKAVGPNGRVYAIVPTELFQFKADADAAVNAIAANKAYTNVKVLKQSASKFSVPEKIDVIWTSMNYHDLHAKFLGPADVPAVNKAIFDALKPGGIYVVLDHAGEPGSGLRDTESLHRIDPEVVKKEIQAAGFVLDAASDALHNPEDKHTAQVFDPALRGKTDKFLFKFRKPAGAGTSGGK